MTRTQHYSHPTRQFPVYCLDWADDAELILGGGGGASRSGIKNKIKLAKVSPDGRRVQDVSEIVLSSDEDAPMTLALDRESSLLVTGINGSEADVQAGRNPNCRIYSYKDNTLAHVRSQQTIDAAWSDDFPYQKLTAISGDAAFVAVGSTDNCVSLLAFPTLDVVIPSITTSGGDLVDLSWGGPSGLWLAITTAEKIEVRALTQGEKPSFSLLASIPAPPGEGATLSFRAARFAPETTPNPPILAVLNSGISRKDRKAARKAFVVKFEAEGGKISEVDEKETEESEKKVEEPTNIKWTLSTRREIARKPVTTFDVSPDGRLVAFGSSDLCIGMLDAKTLAPLLKILQVHSFPPTALKFNPSATLLVSASADNTIRTIVVPRSFGSAPSSFVLIILALLILVAALLLRK